MTQTYDGSLNGSLASDSEGSTGKSDGSTEAGDLQLFNKRRKLYRLGISREYVRDWMPKAAFKEFYRNWYVFLIT